jgi:nucleoside-diphosphate-sugar epimerase
MYGITKYAAERTCLRLAALWNFDVRIGRLATAYGRWEHATAARDRLSLPTQVAQIARSGGEAVFPPLGPTDYIYAPDLARALLVLLDAAAPAHRLYHLGTGAAWALPEWCELLAGRYPAFRWRESAQPGECNVVPLSPGTRTRFSIRRFAGDFGYKPRYGLAAALEDFSTWMGEQHET